MSQETGIERSWKSVFLGGVSRDSGGQRLWAWVLVLGAVLLILPGGLWGETGRRLALFEDSGAAPQAMASSLPLGVNVPGTKRARVVSVAPPLTLEGGVREGDRLEMGLFPDIATEGLIDRVVTNVHGTLSVRARIEDRPQAYLLLSTTAGRTLGSLRIPEEGRHFVIMSDGTGQTHVLMEVDESMMGNMSCGLDDSVMESVSARSPEADEAAGDWARQLANDPTARQESPAALIKVMIVFTPAARAWGNSLGGGIMNVVAMAMERATVVLDNSGTGTAVQLVQAREIDYAESGDASVDLRRLTFHAGYDPWDGEGSPRYMEEVHQWRNEHAADLVSLFALVNDTGGLGWLPLNANGTPQLGFSLTRVQQASMSYTHIHEMGHNIGCHHHRDQVVQAGPGLFTYSAGWRWQVSENLYHATVMSYDGSYFEDRMPTINVPHFSNPSIDFEGSTTGHPGLGDNARTIREMRQRIAAYRKDIFPPTIEIHSPEESMQVSHETTSFSFSGAASAPEGVVASVHWRRNNGAWQNATGTESWSFTVPNLAVGTNTIAVRSRNTDNVYSAFLTRTITRQPSPSSPLVMIDTPATSVAVPNATSNYPFSGTAIAPDSSVVQVQWRVNSGTWQTASGMDTWSFAVGSFNLGNSVVDVRARNFEDVLSPIESRTITRLPPPPTVVILSPSENVRIPNEDTAMEFSGTAAAASSVVSGVEWRLNGGGWEPGFGTTEWIFGVVDLPVGENLVEVRASNAHGVEGNPASRLVVREAPQAFSDINNDGLVNVADVTALANLLRDGAAPGPAIADINGDGVVDEVDVSALAQEIVE